MILTFEKQELLPASGPSVMGTVEVYVKSFNTSFTHEHGTERGVDFELTVEDFTADGACDVSDAELDAMLKAWREANEARIIRSLRKGVL